MRFGPQLRLLALLACVGAALGACSTATLAPAAQGDGEEGSSAKKKKQASTSGDGDDDDKGAASTPPGSDAAVTPSTLPVTSSVRVIVQPSDNGESLLKAITDAKTSVHVTMYLLTDDDIEKAIVVQAKAKHDVKIVLNQQFPPDVPNANLAAYDSLKKQGVDVVWAPTAYTFTHQKTVIVDAKDAWIMTMNATYSSPSNREYLVVDSDPQDVADAEQIFANDYSGRTASVTTKLVVSPENGSQLDARSRLLNLIDGATTSIDVAGETMSDDTFVRALIARSRAGVAVRIVLDGSNGAGSSAQQDSVAELKAAAVPIVTLSKPSMHAKAIVADGKLAYVGSQNFTGVSLTQNRELGVIFDAAAEVAKVAETIAKDFAAGKAP